MAFYGFLVSLLIAAIAMSSALKMTSSNTFRGRELVMNDAKPIITIGTRGSPLALAQAYETKRLLGLHFPELAPEGAVEIKKIMTKVNKLFIANKNLFIMFYFIRRETAFLIKRSPKLEAKGFLPKSLTPHF